MAKRCVDLYALLFHLVPKYSTIKVMGGKDKKASSVNMASH